jgi:hypothetical protein
MKVFYRGLVWTEFYQDDFFTYLHRVDSKAHTIVLGNSSVNWLKSQDRYSYVN